MTHKGHRWVAPPAGQGGQFEKLCAACGGRRSVMGDGECSGTGRDVTLETKHDYDPYAD